jgi:hypothetical protein
VAAFMNTTEQARLEFLFMHTSCDAYVGGMK